MIKRLIAIGFIFCCTSIAWMILGSAIRARTFSTDANLRQQVQSIWGSPQVQTAPDAIATAIKQIQTESSVDGQKVVTNTQIKADQVSIHWAFVISALVSIVLVVSYLLAAIGNRFAFIEAGLAQLVYLVMKGLTGLAITIGAILTLFVMMQLTAKIKWNEVFAKKAA